ncbi:MAG: hypothetical protein K6V97_01725 [Actinomycetia bacterium]|nr:hypothetical protein [Actinomycetes bacterium]
MRDVGRRGPLGLVLGGLIFLGAGVVWWRTVADRPRPAPPAVVMVGARPAGARWRLVVSWWTAGGRRLAAAPVPGTGVAQVTVEAFRGSRLAASLTLIRTASWDAVRFDPRTKQ